MDGNIRELSSHLTRERRGKDSALEDLLEFWGAWRANVISGLSASSRSPITIAIEQYKAYPNSNHVQPKQTRTIQPLIPKYWPNHRMSLINQAVYEIPQLYQNILIHKYEHVWTIKDFINEFNWSKETSYTKISEARKHIRNHRIIQRMLHRI